MDAIKLENLELKEVIKNKENTNVVLKFVDENGDVYDVKFNKLKYDVDSDEYVANKDKAKKVDENLQEYFNETFDTIENAIGARKDIYVYLDVERPYNALWQSNGQQGYETFEKVDKTFMKKYPTGVETKIRNMQDTGTAVIATFEIDGKLYKSQNFRDEDMNTVSMNYSNWVQSNGKWKPEVQGIKKLKALKLFKEEFNNGVGMEGKKILVIPTAINTNYYLIFSFLPDSQQDDKFDL